MNKDQKEFFGKIVEPGMALIKDPRFPEPFLVKVPLVELEKNIDDDEVLERLRQHLEDIYHPSEVCAMSEAIRKYQGKPPESSNNKAIPRGTTESTTESKSKDNRLDPEAESVLALHSFFPNLFDSSEQIFARAGISSGSKKEKIKRILSARDFIREHKLQKGKTYLTLWEITDSGWQYLKEFLGKEPPIIPSKGGFLHQGSAYFLTSWAKRKGWACDIEKPVGAKMKLVDVVVTNRETGELIGVELCTSDPLDKEINNILQDLSEGTGLSKVVVAVVDSKHRKKMEDLIKEKKELEHLSDRIKVCLIGDFIE